MDRNVMKLLRNNQALYLIVFLGFVLRLIALPFSQVVDADAVTRVFIAGNWLANPHFIYEGIWLPIHFYFNGIAIAIFGERVTGPILFHIILTCLTAIPLFYFTKREFSEKGAWFVAAFYMLSPIVFRNSFHTLSGLPYAFFVAHAMNHISKSVRNDDFRQAIYAGLYMTIAAGFRYEAWLLIAIFTGVYLLFRKWKYTVYFWVASMIFPAFWMAGNYIAHGNIFFGLSGTYEWNILMEGVNDQISTSERITRLLFFPVSWFLYFSPLLVIWLAWKAVQAIKTGDIKRPHLIWSIPFWVVFIMFGYRAYEGTLLLFHRYTISLILLSAPFTALIFEHVRWERLTRVAAVIILASLIPLSYVWMGIPVEKMFSFNQPLYAAFKEIRTDSQQNFQAIPRLSIQKYVDYSKVINSHITEESGLILDFVMWDNTFYLALNSQLPRDQVYIVDGSKHGQVYHEGLQKICTEFPTGVILLKCFSKFSDRYQLAGNILTLQLDDTYHLKLTYIAGEMGVGIFEYEVTDIPGEREELAFDCPEKNSLQHILFSLRYNYKLQNDIRRKARDHGHSFEKQFMNDAQWILENQPEK